MMNSGFDEMKLTKLNIDELIRPEAFSNSVSAPSTGFSPVVLSSREGTQSSQEEINAVLCPLYLGVDAGTVNEDVLLLLLDQLQDAFAAKDWRRFRQTLRRCASLNPAGPSGNRGVSEPQEPENNATTGTSEGATLEEREERAAIMEYDGGLPRAEAEACAGIKQGRLFYD